MNILLTILLVVQVICAFAMIGLILMQQGKGANAGATFGGGASGSLFGSSGSATFLSHTTAVLTTIFFACTLVLAYLGKEKERQNQQTRFFLASHMPGYPAFIAPSTDIPASP